MIVFFESGKALVVSIDLLVIFSIVFTSISSSRNKWVDHPISGSYGILLVTNTDFLRGSSSTYVLSLGSALLGFTSSVDLPLSNFIV